MIIDIIAGIVTGIIGAMGFGGGGILILYLTLYKNIPQLTAQGINLICFVPAAIAALAIHTKNNLIDRKLAVKYICLGLVGVIIGYSILSVINENLIRKIFSIIMIAIGVKGLLFKNKN